MPNKWCMALLILAGMGVLLFTWAIPVRAQEATPENDANCVACHEHQYYVYDSGKWFCLCDAPMHCVYCHGGRTDSMVEEVAHEGLVLYPTRDHAARCQTCHTEDYMARAVTFASVAGVSSTPRAVLTATPAEVAAALVEGQTATPVFISNKMEPWQLAVLSALGIALIGIIIFGYRCWKADCFNKVLRS